MKYLLLNLFAAAALFGCGAPATQTGGASQSVAATAVATDGGALVNAIRAEAGLPALSRNAALDRAALAHARDMAANDFMSHTGSDGSTLRTRVDRVNYRWCTIGENVARGHRSDASAVEGWRTSQGHYRNMVKRDAQDYGLANVEGFRVLVVGARSC